MAARDQDQMSFHRHDGRLDATAGREVMYCHACSHEWYSDQQGVRCPQCDSEIIEIVDPENDPRDIDDASSASTSPELSPFQHRNTDSDPEEADIGEHLGPRVVYTRNVRNYTDTNHHNPAVSPVLEQFLNVIQSFGPPRTADNNLFANDDLEPQFGPRIQRTTFTSSPFGSGTTQVTIVSGPMPRRAPGGVGGDPFQAYESPGLRIVSMSVNTNSRPSIFSNVVRDMNPHTGEDEDQEMGGPPQAFTRSLHDILNLISPGASMHGDAVDTQEALDRIITNLMDANPQSNAAPPASEEGIQKLDRRTVDQAMLAEEAPECSICIDALKEGDTAVFLPCKHFFHEECVVLWLKAHNTCPICRAPIEKYNPSPEGNPPGTRPPFDPPSEPGTGPPQPPWSGMPSNPPPRFSSFGEPSQRGGARPWRFSRPPSQSQSRINEVLRTISSQPRPEREQASTSGFDTSRLQRRSHSPTSPRTDPPGLRQRSPSQSSRRSDRERRQSGSGPINWFRGRFSGPSRDSRRH